MSDFLQCLALLLRQVSASWRRIFGKVACKIAQKLQNLACQIQNKNSFCDNLKWKCNFREEFLITKAFYFIKIMWKVSGTCVFTRFCMNILNFLGNSTRNLPKEAETWLIMKQKLAFAENSLLFMRKVRNDADPEADSCLSLNIRENHSDYALSCIPRPISFYSAKTASLLGLSRVPTSTLIIRSIWRNDSWNVQCIVSWMKR